MHITQHSTHFDQHEQAAVGTPSCHRRGPHAEGRRRGEGQHNARRSKEAGKRRVISRLDLDSRRPRGGGGRNAAATHLSLAPSRQGRGARGAAAGHVSLGSSTRGALTAGATGTQRRPIYSFSTRLAGRSASGGPSLTWGLDSRRPRGGGGRNAAAAHLLLGISTHDARAAAAAGTQRRHISRLGSRLTTPARRRRPERSGGPSLAWRPNSRRLRVRAVAAGVQRRPMSRLVARLAAPSRRARPGRSGEVNSQRPRGGGGRDIAADHLSLRNPTRGAFATGPGRPEDSN
eukprot:tig00020956_g16514.t1